MRQILTAILTLTIFLLPAPAARAQSADSETNVRNQLTRLLPEIPLSDLNTLIETGELSRRFERGAEQPSTRLAPGFSRQIDSSIREIDPTIGVEVLFLLDSPEQLEELDAQTAEIMHSISTMEGIEYYSASRDRMRTFFHESYVIDDPESRERVPDPSFSRRPNESSIYAFQRDSSFGSNVYQLDYRMTSGTLWLAMTNLTQMFYQGILPALGPELLQMHLVVRPIGDRILFYGTSAARPGFLFGMEDRVERSFYNRLVALHDWFIDQISAAEGIRSREQDPGRAR